MNETYPRNQYNLILLQIWQNTAVVFSGCNYLSWHWLCLEYLPFLSSHHTYLTSCSFPSQRKNQELTLLLKWPQCTLFNDFGTLCCNKIKKIYKIQIYKISSFFKVLREKSCNQRNLFIMKHYFPLHFITNCNLLNRPKWQWFCSTSNTPHTVLSTRAHGPWLPANKDTLTIRTLKECLDIWSWNIYIYKKAKNE